MSELDPQQRARRNRLVGRLILLFFGALLLVYFAPMVVSLLSHHAAP
jgi:hypothetical protein